MEQLLQQRATSFLYIIKWDCAHIATQFVKKPFKKLIVASTKVAPCAKRLSGYIYVKQLHNIDIYS